MNPEIYDRTPKILFIRENEILTSTAVTALMPDRSNFENPLLTVLPTFGLESDLLICGSTN